MGGEGTVVVLLKRLADALRDGDRILAVVRGTALNNDGRTVTITTPSRSAQVEAYRDALAVAGVDASSIGMVETHGTGTPTGDPIEYASLAEVYGIDTPCALGAAKTNFGHSQSTAGTLGLVKAILALQHGVIPRNLHFTRLPDDVAQIETNLFVPQENTPWPINGNAPRRAAVSAYGFSGTNAHAIVEQAPETTEAAGQHDGPPKQRRNRCCSRCRLPRPTNCAAPQAGSPTGCRHTTTWHCRTWPTRWLAGARTARSAPPSSPTTARSSSTRCAKSPRATRRISPLSGKTTGAGVGVFRAGFAVGRYGRAAPGDRAGVRRHRRAGRADDRR
ncbi:beta-ketoacyl synthase, C-terminal domain protein [Mycobacterium xenopi 4042]|uniref:Beta-ketoacyl synthase, C-terminal domain protein n=1 Tax=Mycobacterium xenopi 4042 TaxID=1299334 RepID=X8DI80_MYCXE|nr:beta-ketoacyl synthase, C-terminal domain protein [Mycobacterium xenopi 4042]